MREEKYISINIIRDDGIMNTEHRNLISFLLARLMKNPELMHEVYYSVTAVHVKVRQSDNVTSVA